MNNNYLKLQEKQFLFKKYVKNGLNKPEADQKVKNFCKFLSNLSSKLSQEGKSQKQMDIKFKAEFEKLCREIDV